MRVLFIQCPKDELCYPPSVLGVFLGCVQFRISDPEVRAKRSAPAHPHTARTPGHEIHREGEDLFGVCGVVAYRFLAKVSILLAVKC